MDEHNDFDSISWQREDAAQAEGSAAFEANLPTRHVTDRRSESMSSEPQAGDQADNVDLAGIGRDGVLEVTVDAPLKENDGTKDAYVSYLVTTHVSFVSYSDNDVSADILCRQTSRRSRKRTFLSGDASQTSSSSDKRYIEITQPVPFLRYPRRTIWPM